MADVPDSPPTPAERVLPSVLRGLALSDLPPMRQFGLVSATAFLLSMVADFTALPAALWIVFRERPDSA